MRQDEISELFAALCERASVPDCDYRDYDIIQTVSKNGEMWARQIDADNRTGPWSPIPPVRHMS